ncbi:hypothetical protein ACFP1I_22350 [Dyadobacter subterraneus]|uniref:Outer membrane protein beta-barrel domain-containing protein n=1 Tax=Dyadobacter subterraneus TaxID=2773304 RepID=A0ABR9WIZ4_9BACT|nr:hypothetical protein [Dyadobacter subterraneus]MBE9465493.1 hypothetical protein [Dyadobacter subterraneus]
MKAYNDATRYFKVSMADINMYASNNTRLTGSLAFGLINFPFKYRIRSHGDGDFAGAFNFGAGLGYTFPKRKYRNATFSMITGYSISNTILDKSAVRRNEGDLVETNNYSAFSISIGPMVENNRVQAGLFFGTDLLSKINQERFGWKHQGKPWISIGIGYSIFSKQEATAEGSNKDVNKN